MRLSQFQTGRNPRAGKKCETGEKNQKVDTRKKKKPIPNFPQKRSHGTKGKKSRRKKKDISKEKEQTCLGQDGLRQKAGGKNAVGGHKKNRNYKTDRANEEMKGNGGGDKGVAGKLLVSTHRILCQQIIKKTQRLGTRTSGNISAREQSRTFTEGRGGDEKIALDFGKPLHEWGVNEQREQEIKNRNWAAILQLEYGFFFA